MLLCSCWAISSTYFSFLFTTSNHNFPFTFSSFHYSQPLCHSSSIPSSSFYFGFSYPYSITINMSFSFPFYTYFLTWKMLLLSLSLSCFFFFWCEFFIFCISTLDWWIYVFFRILLWVDEVWFCVFKLISFFFPMIVKCYSIAFKDSLQEFYVILLYSMVWIIWCLTYDYIFYFDASSSHFISLSLSLSLSLSIYILFINFCNFALGWWIIVFFFF